MKLLFHYMGRHLRRIGLGMTVKVAAAFLELLIPYVLEYIIDRLAPQGRAAPVIAWGLVMAGLAWSVRWGNIFANQSAAAVSRDCTRDCGRTSSPAPSPSPGGRRTASACPP